ncbi:unnamed protein product, partial [Allacma fusca]
VRENISDVHWKRQAYRSL